MNNVQVALEGAAYDVAMEGIFTDIGKSLVAFKDRVMGNPHDVQETMKVQFAVVNEVEHRLKALRNQVARSQFNPEQAAVIGKALGSLNFAGTTPSQLLAALDGKVQQSEKLAESSWSLLDKFTAFFSAKKVVDAATVADAKKVKEAASVKKGAHSEQLAMKFAKSDVLKLIDVGLKTCITYKRVYSKHNAAKAKGEIDRTKKVAMEAYAVPENEPLNAAHLPALGQDLYDVGVRIFKELVEMLVIILKIVWIAFRAGVNVIGKGITALFGMIDDVLF